MDNVMPVELLDDALMSEVANIAALDRDEDFYDIPLLTAHHLEAIWGWPAQRGSVMREDGTFLAPHAWNELPDGGIIDAHGPSGIYRLFPGDSLLVHYRKEWFPWMDEVQGVVFGR